MASKILFPSVFPLNKAQLVRKKYYIKIHYFKGRFKRTGKDDSDAKFDNELIKNAKITKYFIDKYSEYVLTTYLLIFGQLKKSLKKFDFFFRFF